MGLVVWITRSRPGAVMTGGRLRAMGHEPILAPLIEARRCEKAEINLAGADALAFTSVHGVQAFAHFSFDRWLPVYAVGGATAAAAREAGFPTVFDVDGDVDDLAQRLIAECPYGIVVSPGAKERAGDLAGRLYSADVVLREVTVYETVEVDPPMDFDPTLVDLALVHSPKGGRALAAFLSNWPAPDLEVLCISLAAAAPLAATPLAKLEAAPSPNEAALLALL